jgi:PEP-CTERM motif-containing protein
MKSSLLRTAALRGVAFLGAGLALALAGVAHATPANPNLPGNTQYDEWANLNSANFPGLGGGFPGAAPWPAGGVGSNVAGSGDAQFTKVSGNGFAASGSIYHGGFSATPNTLGGTMSVTDATPLAGLQTLVFQIEIGEAFGFDFFNDVAPVLSYNGGSQALAADAAIITSTVQNGTFPNPITGDPEPIFVNVWEMTWDVSTLGAITSLAFQWTDVQHSQIYALRLDQSDVAVPEPGTLLLLVSGLFGLGTLGRRRSA